MDAEGKLRFLRDLFREEATEGLQQLNADMVDWEKSPSGDNYLERLHRTTHNLKGAAASVDLTIIRDLCHTIETAFRHLETIEEGSPRPDIGIIYSAFDALAVEVDKLPEASSELDPRWVPVVAGLEAIAAGDVSVALPAPDLTWGAMEADVVPDLVVAEGPQPDTSNIAEEKTAIAEPPVEAVIATDLPVPVPEIAASVPQEKPVSPEPAPQPKPTATPRPSVSAPSRSAEREETIRVSVEKLDRLMGQIGQIDLTQTHSELRVSKLQALWLEVERQRKEMDLARDEIRRFAREADPMRYPRLLEFHKDALSSLRTLHEQVGALAHEASSDHRSLEILGVHLREDINRLRMRPVSSILEATPREVRDLSSRFGKEVELVINGGEVEVDKHVLEALRAPVMHMVRNSLDHGLEPPDERVAAGKPPKGRLSISCAQIGSNIRVEVADNGRGFVGAKIAQAAVAKGIVTSAEVAAMGADALRRLILRPGFSTAAQVTDVSGRGVGLDVVASSVTELGGSVELGGEENKGARVAITLPLTMATSQALFVASGGYTFALPTAAIERVAKVKPEQLIRLGQHQAVMVGDDPIDVVRLSDLIHLPGSNAPKSDELDLPFVVIGVNERRLAVVVDELLEARQVVVKQLGDQLRKVNCVSGATIDGTGRVILILNPFDLLNQALSGARTRIDVIKAASSGEAAGETGGDGRQTVLVVDDSATVREMEKSILEAAGFNVVVAESGEAAVERFPGLNCPIAFFDLDMPGIGGFEAIRQIRRMPGGRQLKVVIVSSRTDEASHRTAKELDVLAFITKAEFEPAMFLRLVAQHV